ncbi:MAG: prepilin-type N-terminal cleavage/methylation domain-containing protein [Planctomycetes bacterium]|nr:prepilin-type N-terminal cleavage/methylation domain-containing protein [Planctomycetota bacterium]
MASNRKSAGFTLVEVLIVVVIMAILAATIIPQFSDSTKDAKSNTSKFNLHTIRSQIELFKSQHDGKVPANLVDLTKKTNVSGVVGTTTAFPYGPYLKELPENPFTGSAKVTAAAANPPTAAGGTTDAGWLYHSATGGVWIDNAELLTE